MVESPGDGVAAPMDSSDNLLGNDQVLLDAQVLNSVSVPPPQSPEINYPKSFIRSSSDSNIRVAVSPLPNTVDLHQGSFCSVEDSTNTKILKQSQKGEVINANTLTTNRDSRLAAENDTFLNASMQLMHLNGESRQHVRQLWTSVQRLGRENQISEAGMDLLYVELGNILKAMSAEKLEAAKPLKSGRLVLLASSPASEPGEIGGGAAVKALFGSRPTAQLMQCSLSEDQGKFEMTPIRQASAPANKRSASSPPNPPTSTLGRFALPSTASLMGIISDAFQEEPTTRVIRLQGCQVRRLVPRSSNIEATNVDNADEDGSLDKRSKIFHRFQLLVPYKTQMNIFQEGVRADVLFPARVPVPYESFIFEVPMSSEAGGIEADISEEQVDDWVWALDRVCQFQLHRLEHALREAPTIERYRDTLRRNFPVCISLSWLRNRVDQPSLQRRASVNLSMIQIVKDLYRDKVLLDGHLFSAGNPFGNDVEPDSVSEVVKYMVKKVLEFEHETTSQHRVPGKVGVSIIPSHQPLSPAHRFAKNCEARALAFVERVLQGSSRTQSGGDIYDAISFFCQQEHVSICPVSQDAHPVQMRITTDIRKSVFQVEVQVSMQFKVIELTPSSATSASSNGEEVSSSVGSTAIDSPGDSFRELAVIDGTLSRQFTLGQLSAPGTVTINYISK